MNAFALISAHATVLAMTGSGACDHVYHEDAAGALAFDGSGRLLSRHPGAPRIFDSIMPLPGGERFAFGSDSASSA